MLRRNFLTGGLAILCANSGVYGLNAQERESGGGAGSFLMGKIREAQALLASKPLYARGVRIEKDGSRRVLLAVMDVKTGAVEAVPIRYFRKAVAASSVYTITMDHPGWTITALSGTGMACVYRVENPENKVVLANRFPSFSPAGVEEIVYTAPSPGVHAPEMVEEGLAYLDGVIDAAFAELRASHIGWKFTEQEKLLANAGSSDLGSDFLHALIKAIVAIEHIDHAEFYDADPAFLVEKVLVILGANRAKAFNWSGSSAGAFGLAQFMPETYASIQRAYPAAKLLYAPIHVVRKNGKRRVVRGWQEFALAMRNHVNAVKAMACLVDRELNALLENRRAQAYVAGQALPEERQTAEDYGFASVYALRLWLMACAAYNSGTGRIPTTIAYHGWQWYRATAGPQAQLASLRGQESFLRAKLRRKTLHPPERRRAKAALQQVQKKLAGLRRATLPAETRVYLEKALAGHLFFSP